MPIYVNCSACGQRLAVPDDFLGKQVRCPGCKHVFRANAPEDRTLPLETAAAPSAPVRPSSNDAYQDWKPSLVNEPGEDEWDDDELVPLPALDGEGFGVTTIVFSALTIAYAVVGLAMQGFFLSSLDPFGKVVGQLDVDTVLLLETRYFVGYIGLYLTGNIVLVVWAFQVYRNLQRMEVAGLRHTPGWVVAYFFIPILNLFKPLVVLQEIWRASDPDFILLPKTKWMAARASGLIAVWWAFSLLHNISLNYFVNQLSATGLNSADVDLTARLGINFELMSILTSFPLILMIRGINRRQRKCHELLKKSEEASVSDSAATNGGLW